MKVFEVLNTPILLAESKVDLVLGINKDIPVLKNPNNADLDKILNSSNTKAARMMIDKDSGSVWVWNADFHAHIDVAIHLQELYNFPIQFDAYFIIVKIDYHDNSGYEYVIGGDRYARLEGDPIFEKWKNHYLFKRMFGKKEFDYDKDAGDTYWDRNRMAQEV